MEQSQEIDELFRDRWRTLLSVDDAVAGVIKALTELDVLENTYLFFTSDHGYNLGQVFRPHVGARVLVVTLFEYL
jgi:N-acetylglucosamine-6-sulfatase